MAAKRTRPHAADAPDTSGERCRATKRSGARCTQWPIHGAFVCRMHGGGAPQVKRKAEERIAEARARFLDLIDPSFRAYETALHQGKTADGQLRVALDAARDTFDRVLGKAVQKAELTGAEGGPLVITWEK